MLTATIEQVNRVSLGADLLDEVKPGWEHLINKSILDISLWDKCILGQIFGEYINGITVLRNYLLEDEDEDDESFYDDWFRGTESSSFGFNCRLGQDKEYDILDALWAEEIKDRKENPS